MRKLNGAVGVEFSHNSDTKPNQNVNDVQILFRFRLKPETFQLTAREGAGAGTLYASYYYRCQAGAIR